MAVATRTSRTSPPAEGAKRERWAAWLAFGLVVGSVLAVAHVWLWPIVSEPRRLLPGPDMAWYAWRSELLTARPPAELVLADGPLHVFGGAYRVTTPLIGALLRQVGDVDRFTLSSFLIAGRQILVAGALGAVAYRLRPSAVSFAATTVVTGSVLFMRPFVGYVDNLIALLFASAAIWFAPDARERPPARFALFVLAFLLPFTHPPTAAIFAAVIVGAVALRALLARSIRDALRAERWVLLAGVGGPVAGYLMWLVGMWGPSRTIRDSIHIPPYRSDDFLELALRQIGALQLGRYAPLLLAGLVAMYVAHRRKLRERLLARIVLVWLLPLVGVLGFAVGLRYPYKRFVNATVAPMVIAGIGLAAIVTVGVAWILRARRDGSWRNLSWRRALAGAVLVAVPVALLGSAWSFSRRDLLAQKPWVPKNLRVSLAAVRGYLEVDDRVRPLVFVVSVGRHQRQTLVWGGVFRGNWSQIRAGLPGRFIPQTHVYVGAVRDLLERRHTPFFKRLQGMISRATTRDVLEATARHRPHVILIRRFNRRLGNARYLGEPHSTHIGGGAFLLHGPRFAEPNIRAVLAAKRAGNRQRLFQKYPVNRPGDLGHLARVGFGLLFLLLIPGALAARWLGVRGPAAFVGIVPVVSLAMNVVAGFAVLAVLRRPVTPEVGWLIVGVATAAGAAAWVAGRRRTTPGDAGGSESERGDGEG